MLWNAFLIHERKSQVLVPIKKILFLKQEIKIIQKKKKLEIKRHGL